MDLSCDWLTDMHQWIATELKTKAMNFTEHYGKRAKEKRNKKSLLLETLTQQRLFRLVKVTSMGTNSSSIQYAMTMALELRAYVAHQNYA